MGGAGLSLAKLLLRADLSMVTSGGPWPLIGYVWGGPGLSLAMYGGSSPLIGQPAARQRGISRRALLVTTTIQKTDKRRLIQPHTGCAHDRSARETTSIVSLPASTRVVLFNNYSLYTLATYCPTRHPGNPSTPQPIHPSIHPPTHQKMYLLI